MKKTKEKKINIGTSLTIDQISALTLKLEKEFKNKDVLILSSEKIQVIDLTGIQLLQHFIGKAQRIGKELRINLTIEDDQRLILEKTGFSHLLETAFT